MRFLLTALLAFFAFEPATRLVQDSALFHFLLSLTSLSPNVATLVGAGLIWPGIFFIGCYGIVDFLLGSSRRGFDAGVSALSMSSTADGSSSASLRSALYRGADSESATGATPNSGR